MGSYTNFVRLLVKKHPELKLKLKKAASKQTPFQYIHQSIFMTLFSVIGFSIIVFMVMYKFNLLYAILGVLAVILMFPIIFKFWFSYVDVQIRKKERELDGDLLFVSEYLLVSLESGLPLGNALERLSKLNRPGGRFFKMVYLDFETGKDLETAIKDAINYSPSKSLKALLKKLYDSMTIGVDLRKILDNFIKESSEKKIIEIKGFSKKLNPIIMMYLLLGIVLPSLGITFFILAAALLEVTPEFLKYILIFVFLFMFLLQYMSYSAFKFSRTNL
jgi:Flp pilus assembly protein TadB